MAINNKYMINVLFEITILSLSNSFYELFMCFINDEKKCKYVTFKTHRMLSCGRPLRTGRNKADEVRSARPEDKKYQYLIRENQFMKASLLILFKIKVKS